MTFHFPGRIHPGRCEENFLALFFERRSLTILAGKFKLVSRPRGDRRKKRSARKGFTSASVEEGVAARARVKTVVAVRARDAVVVEDGHVVGKGRRVSLAAGVR